MRQDNNLRLIVGLEQPDSGDIYIDNELMNDVRVAKEVYRWFFIFALWPHMKLPWKNAQHNLLKSYEWLDENIKTGLRYARKLASIDSYFPESSRALKVKTEVALGRPLRYRKGVMMDEPCPTLILSQVAIREEVLKFIAVSITTLYVTHIWPMQW